VNIKEAKEILVLYRPNTPDAQDSLFGNARRTAEADPETRRWFENHCASHLALREKLSQIPVPPGLKEQILSERKSRTPPSPKPLHPAFRRHRTVLAAAAAALLLLTLLVWRFGTSAGTDQPGYRAYRNRMISTATKAYAMNLTTNDLDAVRAFLRNRRAPADYVLPPALQKAQAVGCAIVPWNGRPVSMICFDSGRPLRPGEKSDLWLFVTYNDDDGQPPLSKIPALEQTDWVITADWTQDGNTYLLAAPGNESFLRKYL
jgi:hypothetical protein